ncbi:MAG: hypothetical protein IPM92_01480 [Saprospiraceae bacterium]|nr:hypothetical protein [Saprospiraceae bacterium]
MKKIILSISTLFLVSGFAFAQSADEIIDKYVIALGGKDKLTNLRTIVMEGIVSAQGMEIPVTTTIVHKKGMRIDFSVMGMDAWTIMRPDSGWSFMPFSGQTKPEPIPSEMLKQSANQWDLSGQLYEYTSKGNKVEYLGLDDVEGTECHKLKCVDPNGNVSYYLIDPKTYFLVKTITKINAGGKEMEAETKFSNYKEIEGGFVYPHTVESMNGPMDLTKISVNVDVPDAKLLISNQ